MKNDNIYAALLDVLRVPAAEQTGVLFGTLTDVSPLTVRLGGQDISQGLVVPRDSVFYARDIGKELALLPCERGLLVLFYTQGGEDV